MMPESREASPQLPALASIRRFLRPRAMRERCAPVQRRTGPRASPPARAGHAPAGLRLLTRSPRCSIARRRRGIAGCRVGFGLLPIFR